MKLRPHGLFVLSLAAWLPVNAGCVSGSSSPAQDRPGETTEAINGPGAHEAEQWLLDRAVLVETPVATCTGTRIGLRFVMTAAHCGADTNTIVSFYTTGPDQDVTEQSGVSAVFMRPGVSTTEWSDVLGKYADIAILELDQVPRVGQVATLAWSYPGSGPTGTKVGAGAAFGVDSNVGTLMATTDWIRTDNDEDGPFRTGHDYVDKGDSGDAFYYGDHVLGTLSTSDIYSRYTSTRVHLPWILDVIGYRWSGQPAVWNKTLQGHALGLAVTYLPESGCQYACEHEPKCVGYNMNSGVCLLLDSITGDPIADSPTAHYALRYGRRASVTGDPVAYVRSDGYSAVVHDASDHHLHELYFKASQTPAWSTGDLMTASPSANLAGAPPNASGRATVFVDANGANDVVYGTANGSIIELSLGAGWQWFHPYNDLGAPSMAGDPAAYVRNDEVSSIVFRDLAGDVQEISIARGAAPGSGKVRNLSAYPGQVLGQHAPAAASSPSAYVRSDGLDSVVYRGTDNTIYELYSKNGTNWGFGYPWSLAWTENGSASPVTAVGNPHGYTHHDGTNAILYRGSDNHVHELWLDAGGWHVGDITGLAGAQSWQLAAGDPFGYVRADGKTAVVYRSVSNDLIELVLSGATWQIGDLTSFGPASWLGAVAGDPVGYVRSDGVNSVLFRDAANHVRELTMTGQGWQAWDLSSAASEAKP